MSSEEDKDAKQFDASEQKLRKAREKGDIPRSTEVNALMGFLGLGAAVLISGFAVKGWLIRVSHIANAPDHVPDLAWSLFEGAGLWLMGLLLIPAAMVLLGLIVQRGLVISPEKLKIDFNRLNPAKNFGKKFGRAALGSFAISVVKVVFVGLGGVMLFRSLFDFLAQAAFMRDQQWVAGLGQMLKSSIGLAIGLSALLAIIDYLWKRHDYLTRNRMTRKEMQDEMKDSEGDPHLKQARRQRGIDLISAQVLSDVARADVIIVNPTHYAVALEWKRESGRAPVCLAKGVDEVARRIREHATENDVPIWSDPPCARALYAVMEVGDEIPIEQFAPVAAAIRFAEAIREKARKAGW